MPVPLIVFYYRDAEEVWDEACRAGFLGSFYPLEQDIQLTGYGRQRRFHNAEAAFQALRFWNSPAADDFENATGSEALQLKQQLRGQEDLTYGGRGSNWAAMWDVHWAKFSSPKMREALRRTGDAFLLEHNNKAGKDSLWSDNFDGTGTNWRGLQLMLLRDQLTETGKWTAWLSKRMDLRSGRAYNSDWQLAVQAAVAQVTHSR